MRQKLTDTAHRTRLHPPSSSTRSGMRAASSPSARAAAAGEYYCIDGCRRKGSSCGTAIVPQPALLHAPALGCSCSQLFMIIEIMIIVSPQLFLTRAQQEPHPRHAARRRAPPAQPQRRRQAHWRRGARLLSGGGALAALWWHSLRQLLRLLLLLDKRGPARLCV